MVEGGRLLPCCIFFPTQGANFATRQFVSVSLCNRQCSSVRPGGRPVMSKNLTLDLFRDYGIELNL